MKLDEDLSPDCDDEFQTDDEENQGQRLCDDEGEDEDTDSQSDLSPRNPSDCIDTNTAPWPRSYRFPI